MHRAPYALMHYAVAMVTRAELKSGDVHVMPCHVMRHTPAERLHQFT